MRDPARIPKVLDAIRRVWESSPDLRLGQLVCVLAHPSRDPFGVEDDRLIEAADELFRIQKLQHDLIAPPTP
jgi:hypothetical protein